MKHIKSIVIISLYYLIFSSQIILGQLGRVKITVVNSSKKPIENVKITILNEEAFDFKREIFTDKEGTAICIGLKPDVYLFVIEKEAYFTQKKNLKTGLGLTREEVTLLTREEALKVAQAKDPASQAINKYNEAINYTGFKEYDKALSLLEEAIALDDSLYQAYFEIGKIYYLKNMFEEALVPLNKTISLKKNYVPAYRLLAASYEKLGKMEEVEKYSKKAKELAGPSGIDKYNEAVKFINDRDLDNAIPLLQEAIKLDPNLAEAYYELGMALLNKGNKEGAIKNLEKYLELGSEGEKTSTAKAVLGALRKS